MDTPFFYGQEDKDAQTYHKSAAALSKYSKTGLTDIEDIVSFIWFLVTDDWWITGQTLLANGGYTTKQGCSRINPYSGLFEMLKDHFPADVTKSYKWCIAPVAGF